MGGCGILGMGRLEQQRYQPIVPMLKARISARPIKKAMLGSSCHERVGEAIKGPHRHKL